jgi:hypothetical protein
MENTKYLVVTHKTYSTFSLSFACSVHHVVSERGLEQLDISVLIPCSVVTDHKALIQLCTVNVTLSSLIIDIFIARPLPSD